MTSDLNVRAGPGTDYAVVGALSKGQTLTIAGKSADDDWWQFAS